MAAVLPATTAVVSLPTALCETTVGAATNPLRHGCVPLLQEHRLFVDLQAIGAHVRIPGSLGEKASGSLSEGSLSPGESVGAGRSTAADGAIEAADSVRQESAHDRSKPYRSGFRLH